MLTTWWFYYFIVICTTFSHSFADFQFKKKDWNTTFCHIFLKRNLHHFYLKQDDDDEKM